MYSFGPSYYGGGYEPYSSYIPARQYYQPSAYSRPQRDPWAEARARALAEQRARRAQWLPDEDEDYDDDEDQYDQLGPRERMYLEARKRQQELERVQREREEQQRAIEEQRWQKQLEQRQREEDERRQRILEEQRAAQQRKREEARRMAEAANARESGLHRAPSSPRRQSQIPIDDMDIRSSSRSPTPQRQASPPQPSPPREHTPEPQYGEEHELAAAKIQAHFRIHKSLQSITAIEKEFREMRDNFTFPSALDFQVPNDGHMTVQVRQPPPPIGEYVPHPMDVDGQSSGKLAYTSLNYGIHAYSEAMLKMLMRLDGVESWGSRIVRDRRRTVVKEIEAEVQRVDSYWKNAWREHLRGMETDQESS